MKRHTIGVNAGKVAYCVRSGNTTTWLPMYYDETRDIWTEGYRTVDYWTACRIVREAPVISR